jgi:hypothetical protein
MWNQLRSTDDAEVALPLASRRRVRASCALAAVALMIGCGGAFADGEAAFHKGRYPEAKHALLSAGRDFDRWDERRQAEYALYLGLTHAELGDVSAARPWLHRAKAIEDEHPGILDKEDWIRLKAGLEEIEPPASVDSLSPTLHPTE